MKHLFTIALSVTAAFATTSCGGKTISAPFSPPANTAQYTQIERLARPAVKEATQMFAQHDDTNRTSPAQLPLSSQSLFQAIGTFVTQTAGRRSDYATTIQSILIPDEIAVDLAQPTTKAAYLGVETKGATGSAFGGRALTDDVIDADLGVLFGTTLSDLGLLTPDGKASPCLTTDNVAVDPARKHFSSTFPFVGTPN